MSKASNRWIRERYYTLMGLEAPPDTNLLQQFNNQFYTDFLVPATYIVSGKSKDEFDFDRVKECNADSLKYLSEAAGAGQVNQLISIFYRTFDTPVWMLCLKDLVDLYEYTGLLSQSIGNAVGKYMETHSLAYATYSADACDIQVLLDSNGNPVDNYVQNCYIYSDEEVAHYGIKHGSCTVIEVCEKPWYQYDAFDKHLVEAMTYDVSGLLHSCTTPMYDKSNGEVYNASFNYLSAGKPPAEVAELLQLLPAALIEEYGDPINALSAYAKNNPGQVTTAEAKDFIQGYESLFAKTPGGVPATTTVKLPEPILVDPTDETATTEELQKLGYVVRDGADVISDYIKLNNLSADITVADLLKYMSDDTEQFQPKPFDKQAYAKEVIENFDWDQVRKDAIASVDRAAIVREELSKIGVDPDTLSRINIAVATGSTIDMQPTSYVDRFDEAGAVMLHGVRELLSKDASLENRQRVQDVIYAYLVIMMGEEKKLPTVIQFTADKRDKAQGDAKELIEKAMEVLQRQ